MNTFNEENRTAPNLITKLWLSKLIAIIHQKRPQKSRSRASTLERAADATKHYATIIGLPILIIGGLFNGFQIYKYTIELKLGAKAARLTQFTNVSNTFNEYKNVANQTQEFISGFRDRKDVVLENITNRIKTEDVSGATLYYTDKELKHFAEIRNFYEQTGAYVKQGLLDFDVIYELIAFPDEFVEQTEELKTLLKENWKGKGRGLPDLNENITYLYERYRIQRALDKGAKLHDGLPPPSGFAGIRWKSSKSEVTAIMLKKAGTTPEESGKNTLSFRGGNFDGMKVSSWSFDFIMDQLVGGTVHLDASQNGKQHYREICLWLAEKYGRQSGEDKENTNSRTTYWEYGTGLPSRWGIDCHMDSNGTSLTYRDKPRAGIGINHLLEL